MIATMKLIRSSSAVASNNYSAPSHSPDPRPAPRPFFAAADRVLWLDLKMIGKIGETIGHIVAFALNSLLWGWVFLTLFEWMLYNIGGVGIGVALMIVSAALFLAASTSLARSPSSSTPF